MNVFALWYLCIVTWMKSRISVGSQNNVQQDGNPLGDYIHNERACPKGWVIRKKLKEEPWNHCYKRIGIDAPHGPSICPLFGAYLLHIGDDHEKRFVVNELREIQHPSTPKYHYWIQNPDPICPEKFTFYDGNCYSIGNQVMLRSEARYWCETDGYQLAIIKSESENKFVVDMFKSHLIKMGEPNGKQGLWFGLDRIKVVEWVWIDGTAFVAETWMWAEGQPCEDGECAIITTNGWLAAECENRRLSLNYPLCKLPANQPKPNLFPDATKCPVLTVTATDVLYEEEDCNKKMDSICEKNLVHCGQPTIDVMSRMNLRIVGGFEAQRGMFPWQVQIRWLHNSKHLCGGSIINQNWVLTAAHCFPSNKRHLSVVIVAGGTLKHVVEMNAQFRVVAVKEVIKHKHYQKVTHELLGEIFGNDIALIPIREPWVFHEYVTPICLPEADEENYNEEMFVSGFGHTAGTGSDNTLKFAAVKLLSDNACANYCKPKKYCRGHWMEHVICTEPHTQEGLQGVCTGDGGGPLVAKKKGIYKQYGLASYGYKGCKRYPNYYTKVSDYIMWIQYQIQLSASKKNAEKGKMKNETKVI